MMLQQQYNKKFMFERLATKFCFPLQHAAKELKTTPEMLKAICAQVGIKEWPFTKVYFFEIIIIVNSC